MTTLPTTSNYRLPRTTGPGGAMLPPTQPPAGGGPGGAAPTLTPADIWRVIRGNLWLILATVVLAIGIGIGVYAYLLQTDPKYRSIAYLQVNRPYRVNPTNQPGTDLTDWDFNLPIEQRTQQQQLLAESLWSDVLENNDVIRNTGWFKKIQATAARTGGDKVRLAEADLEQNLRASPVTDSKLIQVTMDCASADDAHDIIEAIGNAHIRKEQLRTSDRTNSELDSAKRWKDRYTRDAKQAKDRMNLVMGRISFDVGRQTFKELEMSQLVAVQTKARQEKDQAEGRKNAINEQIDKGEDPFEVNLMVRNDIAVARLTQRVDDLELMSESAVDPATGSRSTKDLQAQLAAAKKKLEAAERNARSTSRDQIKASTLSEFTAKKTEAESIDSRIENIKTELSDISAARAEYNTNKDDYDDNKSREREMNERVAVLANAALQQVGSISWSSSPTRPDTLSSPNLRVILPIAIMSGLALSLGIAFLRELADTSVRSPRDITRVGPMNVLGMVARDTDDPEISGVPLHTVIGTAPTSLLAEQFRQVRTRVQHAVSLDTTRTILITSPGPNDGKTTVACNLAAGLALNGRRILLVDANFHRPALHKLYNVANDAGFSNVLESAGNLEAAVKKTPVANLELLTTGPRPANQTELLESPLFTDFIDRALEEYDHVIFDAGPLLVVSEAVALAPRVDGVVIVVRAKQNTRGMLSRARDTLKQIKAEHIGVVLNGVQTWNGGYYARNIKTYYDYQQNQS